MKLETLDLEVSSPFGFPFESTDAGYMRRWKFKEPLYKMTLDPVDINRDAIELVICIDKEDSFSHGYLLIESFADTFSIDRDFLLNHLKNIDSHLIMYPEKVLDNASNGVITDRWFLRATTYEISCLCVATVNACDEHILTSDKMLNPDNLVQYFLNAKEHLLWQG